LKRQILFMCMLFLSAAASAGEMSVLGKGSVVVDPDQVVIRVGVFARNDEASKAMQDMKDQASRVIDVMQRFVSRDTDVQTQNLSIQPWTRYDRDKDESVFMGYEAETSISMSLADISRLGPALDDLTMLGVGRIGSLSFSVSDPEDYIKQARHLAIRQAIETAKDMAKSAEVTLGSIREISAPRIQSTPYVKTAFQEVAMDAPSPIAAGKLTITEEIQITFDIQ
jgi:uncharacterized protein YggE